MLLSPYGGGTMFTPHSKNEEDLHLNTDIISHILAEHLSLKVAAFRPKDVYAPLNSI
jgi:hypothetical protein